PLTQSGVEYNAALYGDRRVVLVVSAGAEPSLTDVVTNIAAVCADIGQRVALLSTAGLASPGIESELPRSTPSWWRRWPSGADGMALPSDEEADRLLRGTITPTDVESRFGETGGPGGLRLALRC